MSIQRRLLITATLGLAVRSAACGQPSPAMAVLTEKEARLILPAEPVAAMASSGQWSSDGQFVLAVRNNLRVTPELIRALSEKRAPAKQPGEVAISLWSARISKSQDLWVRPAGDARVESAHWLSGTHTALAIVDETIHANAARQIPESRRKTLLRIDADSGVTRPLSAADGNYPISISPSPTEPVAIVQVHRYEEGQTVQPGGGTRAVLVSADTLHVVRETGVLGRPIALPTGMVFGGLTWPGDGSVPCLTMMEPESGKGMTPRYFKLDMRTGRFTPLSDPPKQAAQRKLPLDIRLKSSAATLREGDTIRKVQPLWLEGDGTSAQPLALISPDAPWSALSPRGEYALFASGGSLHAARILRMPRELFLAMQRDAQRAVAISNAKQLDLALMQYIQDHNDTFPGGEGINGLLEPYLNTTPLFDGFNYTYSGGPLKDLSRPAETQLGFVNGPGGRAIMYADGHVVWRGD